MLTQIKGYLYAAGGVAIFALLVGAFLYGEYRVEKADAIKFAVIEQQAKDAQLETDKINIANDYVAKETYNVLQKKLEGYGSTVSDLTDRLLDAQRKGQRIILPTAMAATCQHADTGSVGEATTSNPEPTEPASATSLIATEVLRDDLTLALTNIDVIQAVMDESDKIRR